MSIKRQIGVRLNTDTYNRMMDVIKRKNPFIKMSGFIEESIEKNIEYYERK